MKVSVVKTGHPTVTVDNLPPEATVAQALEAAGLEVGQHKISVNGQSADLTTVLSQGSLVALVGRVKGG